MNLDLSSVRAKLARGQEHAQAIKDEMAAWMNRHPYNITQQPNSDSTRYSLILRENEAAPFLRWTLIFGDFLNNLRSALDYLVYSVAMFESKSSLPPYEGNLAFPLAKSQPEFIETARRRLGDISLPVQAVFERFQPYNRPHPHLPPLLGILRDCNNRDKHRLVKLIYGGSWGGKVSLEGMMPVGANCELTANLGELKDGAEIVAVTIDRPAPGMNFTNLEVILTVNVWHGKRDETGPDGSERTECIALMDLLSDEVRTVIYSFAKL